MKEQTPVPGSLLSRAILRLKSGSLSSKISLLVSCVILVVFLFTLFVLVEIDKMNRAEQRDLRGRRTLDYVQIVIEKEQQYMLGLAEYYSSSGEMQRLVRDSNRGLDVSPAAFEELLQSAKFKMYLLSVVVYNLRGEPLAFAAIDNSYGPVCQSTPTGERPFDRLIADYSDTAWEYIAQYDDVYMTMDHSPKLVLWKKILNTKDHELLGVVSLALDVRKLLALEEYKPAAKSPSVLLSDDGRVVLDKEEMNLPPDTVAMLTETADADVRRCDAQEGRYEIFYQKCTTAPFTVCVVEDADYSLWSGSELLDYGVLLSVFFLVILIPVSWISSRMLTKPLKILSESMTRFSKGDYSAEVNFKYDDDIGRLGHVFNHMVEENKQLVEGNYVLKLREREAELSLLQTQIDPHFLYNMINSIYWCAMKNHDEETADIAYNMGQFFRLSLNRGGEFMPVSKSVDLVICYLELQKYRYGERLHWDVQVAPEILQEVMPKLLLQPIVENAVIHGMGPETEQLKIVLEGSTDALGRLTFSIRDNGVGIPPEILAYLPERSDEAAPQEAAAAGGQRFALKNICERLRILYGTDYAFTIESQEHRGTTVFLSIPKGGRKERQDDTAYFGR